MLKCELCGREFSSGKALSSHIRVHQISPKEYFDTYLKKQGDDICRNHGKVVFCKKHTSFINMVVGYHKYCSSRCLSNTKHIRRQRSKCRLGDKHHTRKPGFVHPFKNKTYEEIHGKEKAKELKSILSRKQTEIMKNGFAAYMNMFITNPSKPQVQLHKKLKKFFPDAILNYPCLGYSIDIAIPRLNLAIEYDGSYWHQDKEKDDNRQYILERQGWRFLRYLDYVPPTTQLIEDIQSLIPKTNL